ncbi:unnamed protein product [Pedinophyceae sp. YPF-701]|nr:unnamed protein product [Pedinophyceae sp. YPF-701]
MSGSILSAALTAQWIFMSAAVIVFNKYILSGDTNWPFPLALTVSHMTVGSICSWALLLSGLVPGRGSVSPRDFATSILPIAGLFAVVLWLGNAAYLYLSVAFIQMTKAVMPAAVFLVGVCAGLEVYSDAKLRILLLICAGVVIASTGELDDRFQLFGFLIQLAACVAEAVRLALVQVLLQRRGLKLNAVATVAYVAPASLCFLLPFFFANEWSLLATWPHRIGSGVLLLNCFAAFGLNLSVFLLVGRTSALTMNLGGIVKDWLLILLSWAWMGAAISGITMAGYLVAFCGLLAFNAATA